MASKLDIDNRKYNVHNLVTIEINNEKTPLFEDLDYPLSYFRTDGFDRKPDIVLNIGKFEPDISGSYLVDHRFHIKDNYFFTKDSGGSAKWQMEISGFEDGPTLINFDSKLTGLESIVYPDLLVQDIILRPMIDYKLYTSGHYLIHAAGLSKGENGFALCGRGSSFKTSLSMDFVRYEDCIFYGDDKIIISKDGDVLSFPTHIGTFGYKLKNLPSENFSNSSILISPLGLLNYLKFLSGINNDQNRANVRVGDSCPLKKMFFIERVNGNHTQLSHIDADTSYQKIVKNDQAEIVKGHTFMRNDFGTFFYRYLLAYSYIFPNNNLFERWNNPSSLREILSGIKLYTVQLPKSYSRRSLDVIVNEL